MPENIKAFVERRIREGAPLEDIWRETGEKFPFKCAGWNYIRGIARKLEKANVDSSTR